jgi:hypothetical protein
MAASNVIIIQTQNILVFSLPENNFLLVRAMLGESQHCLFLIKNILSLLLANILSQLKIKWKNLRCG